MCDVKGVLVGVIGPTCSGKTTIVSELLQRLPNAARVVTYTTRSPRHGEKDGIDYHFVSHETFSKMKKSGELYESSETSSCSYGSSKKTAEDLLAKHDFVFATLDFNGAVALTTHFPKAVIIGITASRETLQRRIVKRFSCMVDEIFVQRSWEAGVDHARLSDAGNRPKIISLVIENNDRESGVGIDASVRVADYLLAVRKQKQEKKIVSRAANWDLPPGLDPYESTSYRKE